MFVALLLVLAISAFEGNPYEGATFFANPHFTEEVEAAMKTYPDWADRMKEIRDASAAIWLDNMQVMNDNLTNYLEMANTLTADAGPVLIQFIIYDLPNRDCHAEASNGEIDCEDAQCAEGLNTYKTQYIDPIVSKMSKYPNKDLRIVCIIEPDSLPNLATNMGDAKCQEAETAYKKGVAYAIKELAALDNTILYIDAAHGGWLGWDDNRAKAIAVWDEVLKDAGGWDLVRGFATNTANYQPLGTTTDTEDPCNLQSQYNFAYSEVRYVEKLQADLQMQGQGDKTFIVDTGRNGNINCRQGTQECSMWCNPTGAGLGRRPEANPKGLGITLDALAWLKTPGESDGTSDPTAPRYDPTCGSSDSFKPSPQAGIFNEAQFYELCENANPPLGGGPPVPTPTPAPGPDTPKPTPSGKCSPVYGQCGGKTWDGPTCCDPGCTCTPNGDYYSQCLPPAGKNTCSSRLGKKHHPFLP